MKTVYYKQLNPWIDASWQWLKETIEVHGIKTIFLPAGVSPIGLYAKMQAIKPDFLNDIRFLQVDDVTTGHARGMFRRSLLEHLPSYAQQFHFVEDGEKLAEAAILGLGLNGHVAFHEPHLPEHFSFGEVTLSEETRASLKLPAGTKGLSHGLGHFLKCRRVLLLVNGSHKLAVLKKVLEGDPQTPASRFLHHPDTTALIFESSEN